MNQKNHVYQAVLWQDDNMIELHTFTLEPSIEKNRYRALTSMQWFQERELEARYGDGPEKDLSPFHLGAIERKETLDKLRERREARGSQLALIEDGFLAGIPHFHHESLWDMYKAIGYDHKLKCWTRAVIST